MGVWKYPSINSYVCTTGSASAESTPYSALATPVAHVSEIAWNRKRLSVAALHLQAVGRTTFDCMKRRRTHQSKMIRRPCLSVCPRPFQDAAKRNYAFRGAQERATRRTTPARLRYGFVMLIWPIGNFANAYNTQEYGTKQGQESKPRGLPIVGRIG